MSDCMTIRVDMGEVQALMRRFPHIQPAVQRRRRPACAAS